MAVLSQDEIGRYHDEGLVVPSDRIPLETVEAMREKATALLVERPDMSPDFIPGLVEVDSSWVEYARHPVILDCVESVIGTDFLNWGSGFFGKPASHGLETPWHQDGEYWPIKPLATCTVWVALDPTTPENGCMQFVPGSHKEKKLLPHDLSENDDKTLERSLRNTSFAEANARDVLLEPGQLAIFDVYTIHGSRPNSSPHRRMGIAFRYMPTTSHFDFELAEEQARELGRPGSSIRQLHLMRGTDRCGRNDFSRNK